MEYLSSRIQRKLYYSAWFNRIAICIVYFWFGLLKVLWRSPAEGLVTKLFDLTLKPFMEIHTFLPAFGIIECIIGIVWLFPKYTKIAFYAMSIHMIATFLPVLMLPDITWQSFMTLTLVGQYIFKNLVMLSAAGFVYVFRKDGIESNQIMLNKGMA